VKINSNKKVILIWVLIITFMATIGISIIIRDSNNGFGTVTFGSIKPFKLTDQTGKVITKNDLSGMVWILNTIAINCEGNNSCENVKSMTMSINEQLKNNLNVKLVSIVIDRENIFAEDFIEFGDLLNADVKNWLLLNGSEEELAKMKSQLLGDFSTALLIDQNGIFRGIYNISNLSEVKKMMVEAKKLI